MLAGRSPSKRFITTFCTGRSKGSYSTGYCSRSETAVCCLRGSSEMTLPKAVHSGRLYKVDFWHAHLNYACLRASDAGLPGGGATRLAGDQLCHWNTLSPDAVFQATHLIVFLPPCLGAFVLSNHSIHNVAFFKFSSFDAPTSESPTACVKQVANFPLPSLLPNQSDTLHTARLAAAEGYLSAFTIPLHAEPGSGANSTIGSCSSADSSPCSCKTSPSSALGTSSLRRFTGPAGTRSCSVTRPDRMLSSTTSANSVCHRCAICQGSFHSVYI